MTRAILFLCAATALGGSAAIVAACSSSSGGASGGGGGGGDAAGDGAVGVVAPEIACSDSIASVYADPGDVSAQPKGFILKCAHDSDIPASALLAAAQTDAGLVPYAGRAFTSGARVYRVLYRTERGDTNGTPGYSSALVFLPDTPRAAQLPVLVVSHASFGQGPRCAPSLHDPASAFVFGGFEQLVYPFVGLGFAVIAPDLAGYANYGGAHNAPSAYAEVEDVGKSTLDGARALRRIIPSSVTQQVVLVGHSQGGQTTLAAMSIADSYGADGVISAAAVYSPLWWSERSFVAIFLEPTKYPFAGGASDAGSAAGPVSIWLHYTAGELLDGPGHGIDVFAPDAQAGIKSFVDNDCWSAQYPDLLKLGASANDVFDPKYVSSMALASQTGTCTPGDTTCAKWLPRLTADYPHLQGSARAIPLLVWYANDDTTITPDTAECIFERLTGDKANYTACYDSDPVGHAGILGAKSEYVADWIAAQTLDAAAPQPCTVLPQDDAGVPQIPNGAGGTWACNPLIPKQ
jgi:pimeloyl-ACP methyl ester carboxylesterase